MERQSCRFDFDRVPKFINKLYKVTDDDKYKGIRWTPDGLKVHIYDRDVFVKETLPLLSKTKEFGTFIRMMNSYGFLKSKEIDEEDIYYNKHFRKGGEELLRLNMGFNMRQRKPNIVRIGEGTLKDMVQYLYVQNQELYTELSACKERVERHERSLNGLVEILSRVFRANIPDPVARPGAPNLRSDMDVFLNGGRVPNLMQSDVESVHHAHSGDDGQSAGMSSRVDCGDQQSSGKNEYNQYDFF